MNPNTGRILQGGALCVVTGEFICDICGRTLPKKSANQRRCQGECSAEAKRRKSARREELKNRRPLWARPA